MLVTQCVTNILNMSPMGLNKDKMESKKQLLNRISKNVFVLRAIPESLKGA